MTTNRRHIAHLHLHAVPDEERYADAIDLLTGLTPHVQTVSPEAVQLDLTSALRYFDCSAYDLVQQAQLRLKGLYDIDSSAGLAANRMLATMAADASAPGRATWVPVEQAVAWLRPRPVTALPGIGRVTATALGRYGLHAIGQVADVPVATLQRILGVGPARLLAERAQGRDPRPVAPLEPSAHLVANLVLERDCLDPAQHRRALLGLADQLGRRLRAETRATRSLTLTVRYADRSTTTRSQTLGEATQHSAALTRTAYTLYERFGLQRARVRRLTLCADALQPAERAVRQLTFDPGDDKARAVEVVADAARARYRPDIVVPATLSSFRGDAGAA